MDIGYGACRAPADVGRMSVRDSETLLAMVRQGAVDWDAEPVLRAYFRQNRGALWEDAHTHTTTWSSRRAPGKMAV